MPTQDVTTTTGLTVGLRHRVWHSPQGLVGVAATRLALSLCAVWLQQTNQCSLYPANLSALDSSFQFHHQLFDFAFAFA